MHRTDFVLVSSSLPTRSSLEFFFRIGENTNKRYGMPRHTIQISKDLNAEFIAGIPHSFMKGMTV